MFYHLHGRGTGVSACTVCAHADGTLRGRGPGSRPLPLPATSTVVARRSSALKTQTKLCSELSLIHALISSGTQVQEGPPDRPPSRPAARTSSAARRRTGLRQGYHTRRAVHERPKHALGRPQPWPQHSSQHTHTRHITAFGPRLAGTSLDACTSSPNNPTP